MLTCLPSRSAFARRWLLRILFVLYLTALGELAARGFWSFKHGVPFLSMDQIFVDRFYPELRESGVLAAQAARDDEENDGSFDVLLLGGSSLTDEFGCVRWLLQEHLAKVVNRPVRTFNCASAAMTSRDSWLKYEYLSDRRLGKHFDLVVLYDGINDVRMNNCPRAMYRDDYAHSSFYHRLNRLAAHREINWTVLPFTLEYFALGVLDSRLIGYYLPRNPPSDGLWFEHGEDLKTPASFRANEAQILTLAAARNEQVVLPTYAYYIPAGYSASGVRAKSLDYRHHSAFVEMWGTPQAVAAGIEAHNAEIRDLAAQHRSVLFADVAAAVPPGKLYYDDICHLTGEGCHAWLDTVTPLLDRWLAATGNLRTVATTDHSQR